MIQEVQDILPIGAVVAGGEIGPERKRLMTAEKPLVRAMSPKRRREFAAGRHYARQALLRLGCEPSPIPTRPSRAPDWPSGVVGSISHNQTDCVAVVARQAHLASIGVDLESADPLPEDLIPLVCRTADCHNRAEVERRVGLDLPKLVFVIKEAFYKAYHPIAGCFLEFTDVEVVVEPVSFSFHARLVTSTRPPCAGHRALAGRFGRAHNLVFAVSWLPA